MLIWQEDKVYREKIDIVYIQDQREETVDVTCVIYKRMGKLLEGGGDGEIGQSTLEMF